MKLPRGLGRFRKDTGDAPEETGATPDEPGTGPRTERPAAGPSGASGTETFERIHEGDAGAGAQPGGAELVVDAWRGALDRLRTEDTPPARRRVDGTPADATRIPGGEDTGGSPVDWFGTPGALEPRRPDDRGDRAPGLAGYVREPDAFAPPPAPAASGDARDGGNPHTTGSPAPDLAGHVRKPGADAAWDGWDGGDARAASGAREARRPEDPGRPSSGLAAYVREPGSPGPHPDAPDTGASPPTAGAGTGAHRALGAGDAPENAGSPGTGLPAAALEAAPGVGDGAGDAAQADAAQADGAGDGAGGRGDRPDGPGGALGGWGRGLPVDRLVSNRFALVGLVVVALAALYGVAHFSTPDAANARVATLSARRVAVVSSLVACPGAELGGGASTTFGVVSPAGATGTGRADVRRADRAAERVARLGRVGGAWFGDVTKPAGPLTVSGSGALAAGLTGGQISLGKGGKGALTGTHCTRPATDSWFVGPGPEDGDLRLSVANPDDGPATVSVDVYSDVGQLDDSETGAIFVPPHGSEVVSLAGRARGARLAALHVRTSMGRVAAAIEAKGSGKAGADFVPGGSAPATRLVVPGVPGGSGARDLLVAAPGDRDANVHVRAVTPDGQIVPGGDGVLQVPAGSVVPMPLDGMLSGRPCALTLTSDAPMVAGLRARSSVSGGTDVAYTSAEPALDGRGVAAVNRGDKGYSASVVLTAIGGPVTARVTTQSPRGAGGAKTVTIKDGHTTEVTPPAPHGAASGYGIVVTRTSGAGRMYAARVLTRKAGGGKLLTVDPLESAAGTVPVYPANGSLDAVVR